MRNRKCLAVVLAVTMCLAILPAAAGAEPTTETYPLYAGQDWQVGDVVVWNDAENLYVKYVLDDAGVADEGWYLTEVHLHVASQMSDFPLAGKKKKNPIPGQFEFSDRFSYESEVTEKLFEIPLADLPELDEGEPYLIAAHAVVTMNECEVLVEAPYGASSVVDYAQGLRWDYTPVRTQRSTPENALGFETGKNEANFFSLGFREDRPEYPGVDDAWLIVEFDYPILNGPGDDLQVIEDTWTLPYPKETCDVWVSQDGYEWEWVGEAGNQDPYLSIHTISDFDLEDVGLDWARFVKVQDTSVRSDFDGIAAQRDTLDGYDVNAIVALNDHETCTTYSETAWGATAVGETRFNTEKGNWATYFEYEPVAEPQYTLVESVEVPSTNAVGVTTTDALENGQTYELRAFGTFTYNNAGDWADAEWYLKDGTIVKGDTEGSVAHVLDVSVDGLTANLDWGGYNSDHEYVYNIVGTGSTIRLFIHDSVYVDNNGSILVEIWKVNW